MVKIETGSRIPIWRTFGRIQWHVIPEPRVTLQSGRIPSAILKIVVRRIIFFVCFPNAVGYYSNNVYSTIVRSSPSFLAV